MADVIDLFDLNEEQKAAVDIDKNIALSAGAGSGKTRVLTCRYLRLIESGIDIDSIAAITFTEKAALEMKWRVRESILDIIQKTLGKKRVFWQGVMDKLNTANISTIHSFCMGIVRENSALTGLDFDFDIIDSTDQKLFLEECTQRVLANCFEDPDYIPLIDYIKNVYGSRYIKEVFSQDILNLLGNLTEKGINLHELSLNVKDDTLRYLVMQIVLSINDEYCKYKLDRDLMDYGDLQSLTLFLFTEHAQILQSYKSRFTRILVDEFQDTNEIQKRIIYSLAADEAGKLLPKHLFVVGDFKQSIYGFRGTDYMIFKEVAEDIGDQGKMTLSSCYRSHPGLIYGINQIFDPLINGYEPLKPCSPKQNTDGVKYSLPEDENRIFYLQYESNKTPDPIKNKSSEIKNLIKKKEGVGFDILKSELLSLKDSLDVMSVADVSNMGLGVIKSIELLAKKGVDLKDICILVRSRYLNDDIESALSRYNIPYCIIGGTGLYDKNEVRDVLNIYELVIKGVDDRTNDPARLMLLLAVLKSDYFQISDDILIEVRKKQNDKGYESFWQALVSSISFTDDEFYKNRLAIACEMLLHFEEIAQKSGVGYTLRYIIKKCNMREILISQKNGIQKLRNLEKLLVQTQKFDEKQIFMPDTFVEYIRLISENSQDQAEAVLDTEDSRAVKIMTIHQSKGLEFGAVIIPGMDKDLISISKRAMSKQCIVYYNGRIQFKIDEKDNCNKEYSEYEEMEYKKETEENIRLLYVAMTRAKEYVVLLGSKNDTEVKNLNTFANMIRYSFDNVKDAHSICFMDMEYVNADNWAHAFKTEAPYGISRLKIADLNALDRRLNINLDGFFANNASISGYMAYKSCPRRYYAEKIINTEIEDLVSEYGQNSDEAAMEEYADELLPTSIEPSEEEHIDAKTRGILVHKVLEYIDRTQGIDADNYIQYVIKSYMNELYEGIQNAELFNRMKLSLERYIKNYEIIENEKNGSYGRLIKSMQEVPFRYQLENGNIALTGFIDRVRIYNKDGCFIASITDYKTNVIKNDYVLGYLKNIYSSQLKIYGKVVLDILKNEQNMKIDDLVLNLYFLDCGKCVQVDYDEKDVYYIVKDINNIFNIKGRSCSVMDFPKTKNKNECKICSYREYCGEYDGCSIEIGI